MSTLDLDRAHHHLAVARRRLEEAQSARATATPGSEEYRMAVRMLGSAWDQRRRAQERIQQMRNERGS